jgi:glycosyltransferase involved in cell wall biosynthesis
MLDPWALRQKKWKKSLYSQVFERRNLTLAACLRAMTVNEAEQYRRFGLSNPIAIIPNGVDIPANVTSGLFLERYPALRGKTIVLFLGRIHPKKGLLPLCLAWSAVQRQFADAHLVIAGPDCEDTVTALHRIIEEQGIQQSVTFAGLLTGLVKWSAYAAATIFTLPSYSEGFSVSVLEALGSGVPVLITEACYFPEVKTVNAGWTIAQVAEIQAALTTALATPLALIHKMGANGAALVAEKYSWPRIASQFADLYDWLLGGSTPTSCPIWAAPK